MFNSLESGLRKGLQTASSPGQACKLARAAESKGSRPVNSSSKTESIKTENVTSSIHGSLHGVLHFSDDGDSIPGSSPEIPQLWEGRDLPGEAGLGNSALLEFSDTRLEDDICEGRWNILKVRSNYLQNAAFGPHKKGSGLRILFLKFIYTSVYRYTHLDVRFLLLFIWETERKITHPLVPVTFLGESQS